MDLNADNKSFQDKNFNSQSLILYFNIFNEFTDIQLDSLTHHFHSVWKKEKRGLKMILYQRNKE